MMRLLLSSLITLCCTLEKKAVTGLRVKGFASSSSENEHLINHVRRLQDIETPSTEETTIECKRILEMDTDFEKDSGKTHHWTCLIDDDGHDLGLPPDVEGFLDEEVDSVKKRDAKLTLSYVSVVNSKIKPSRRKPSISLEERKSLWEGNEKEEKREGRRRHLAETQHKEGTRSVLVLRVNAADASTTKSVDELRERIFGGPNDQLNLVSQYSACSNGKLEFQPAVGNNIVNGVADVTIEQNVVGVYFLQVTNWVTSAATTLIGAGLHQYDHVMYCLPPGTLSGATSKWAAIGYYDWYRTVFNDDWCASVSAQMHEIGHNLNMRHANDADGVRGDKSGYMGNSWKNSEAPYMCFNAAHSSQMGWYSDTEVVLDPDVQSYWSGKLIGLADYSNPARDSTQHYVNLKIVIPNTENHDLYLTYNYQKGINSGTQEYANRVTIVSSGQDVDSFVVAAVAPGTSHTIMNFDDSGQDLIIAVQSSGTDSDSVHYAMVEVIFPCTDDAHCDDGNPCNGSEHCTSTSVCEAGISFADTCAPPANACQEAVCVVDVNNAPTCQYVDIPNCQSCAYDEDCGGDGCNGVNCSLGRCSASSPPDCDAVAPPCYSASCVSGTGCVFNLLKPCCGNDLCEDGEDCNACRVDCNGKTSNKKRNAFCCSGGPDGTCDDSRCTQEGYFCESSAY